MPPPHRYFAYGSNLNLDDWRRFCLAHGFGSAELTPIEPAWLPDTRPVFHYWSGSRQGGALDVERALGEATPGMIFEVADEALAALDRKEGASVRYERIIIDALNLRGEPREVMTYRVMPRFIKGFTPPTPEYLALCLEGLTRWGLPGEGLLAASRDAPTATPGALFVYGSLRRGGAYHDVLQAAAPTSIEPTSVRGRLYALPEGYPGLRLAPDGEDIVEGERVTFEDLAGALKSLDLFEDFYDYRSSSSLYHRVIAPLDGDGSPAWVYQYAGALDENARIPSGRWSV